VEIQQLDRTNGQIAGDCDLTNAVSQNIHTPGMDIFRNREPASSRQHRDLPKSDCRNADGGRTEIILNGLDRPSAEPLIVFEKPNENVCVEDDHLVPPI